MMSVDYFLASGLPEGYVMGALNEAEELLVKSWLTHPKVRQYIAELEADLIAIARADALMPSRELTHQIVQLGMGC